MKHHKVRWLPLLMAVWLVVGCCSNPGVFGKVSDSLRLVQSYYDPLLKGDLGDERVRQAVVAADTTLLVAGELQKQWCPDEKAVEQLLLQVKETEELRRQAGIR